MLRFLSLAVVGLILAAPAVTAQTAAKADPWAGLRFLIGTWEAKTSGGSAKAQGTGTYSFTLELRDHVMVRHSAYATCKGPEDFNCEHGDLLYVYPEGPAGGLQAIYFDNEGHVIHYSVSSPKAGVVVLLSDAAQAGPQFRLSYELTGGVMAGKFQMRMPGQGDFATYLEWSGRGMEGSQAVPHPQTQENNHRIQPGNM